MTNAWSRRTEAGWVCTVDQRSSRLIITAHHQIGIRCKSCQVRHGGRLVSGRTPRLDLLLNPSEFVQHYKHVLQGKAPGLMLWTVFVDWMVNIIYYELLCMLSSCIVDLKNAWGGSEQICACYYIHARVRPNGWSTVYISVRSSVSCYSTIYPYLQ